MNPYEITILSLAFLLIAYAIALSRLRNEGLRVIDQWRRANQLLTEQAPQADRKRDKAYSELNQANRSLTKSRVEVHNLCKQQEALVADSSKQLASLAAACLAATGVNTTASNATPEYRYLKPGEIILKGDEHEHNNHWRESMIAGCAVSGPGKYRRKITSVTQVKA